MLYANINKVHDNQFLCLFMYVHRAFDFVKYSFVVFSWLFHKIKNLYTSKSRIYNKPKEPKTSNPYQDELKCKSGSDGISSKK